MCWERKSTACNRVALRQKARYSPRAFLDACVGERADRLMGAHLLRLCFLVCWASLASNCLYEQTDDWRPDFALLYSLRPFLRNGITWSHPQLAVDAGSEGTYDTTDAGTPTVIREGSSYRMWYSGGAGGAQRIIHAESPDGIHWSHFRLVLNLNASLTGYDTSRSYTPVVRKEGSIYRMWYSGFDGTNVRVLHAESADGYTWTNFSLALDRNSLGAGLDDAHAFSADVGGSYRIWYTAVNAAQVYQIGTCSSANGLSFSGCQLSIPPGTEGSRDTLRTAGPHVFQDRYTHKIWYGGTTTNFEYDIIYCESIEGITWTNCQVAISKGTHGTYDTTSISGPAILVEGGVGKIWYGGTDSGGKTRILYAESH